MVQADENTTVVIVGSGIAGLTVGYFLLRSGIDCVLLEKHSREYDENRQRAGALDARGVRTLREWGIDEVVEPIDPGSAAPSMPLLIDGEKRQWKMDESDEDGADAVFCPQQVLVRNLIKVFLRDGGDLRFESADVSLEGLDTERPVVRYRDATGSAKAIGCDFVAGSDGYHGVSRTGIPADVLKCHTHEFGYAWLTFLAELLACALAVLGVHSGGFAAQISRGPNACRLYLQCPVTDTIDQWPDERVWSELEVRFGEPPAMRGPIVSEQVVPIRGGLQPHELRQALPCRGRRAPHLPDERGRDESRPPRRRGTRSCGPPARREGRLNSARELLRHLFALHLGAPGVRGMV